MANEDVSRRNSPEATGLASNTPVLPQPSRLLNPSFRAEDQAVAAELETQQNVIGPPAYASPDPVTNQGRLVPIEQHALAKADLLSPDYGGGVVNPVPGPVEPLGSQEVDPALVTDSTAPPAPAVALPDNRDEWEKSHWKAYAEQIGVGSSGSAKQIQARVEAKETADAERAEFESDVKDKSREDLDEFAADNYGLDPSTYSTKELLAAAVIASEYDEEVQPGDKPATES